MNAESAAQRMADLINEIEREGLQVAFSASAIEIGDSRVVVGTYEGDPWTVETA